MCQWTGVRHGTWPSCPLLVTSSSTPSWQRMMKWSSCMLMSLEVSLHRNPTFIYKRFIIISVCVTQFLFIYLFFLQIQDLVPFMYQMTGALCTPSHWSATFTPPQGVRQTSLTSPPCEEFSSPVFWQKVSIHLHNKSIAANSCTQIPIRKQICMTSLLYTSGRVLNKYLSVRYAVGLKRLCNISPKIPPLCFYIFFT